MYGSQLTPASPSTNLKPGNRSRAPENTMPARNSAAAIWNIVVRNAREPDEAPRVGLAEVGGPTIVDLVDRLDELAVLHAQADPEDPVHDLGVDAVEVLILQPQIRRGGVRTTFVEADVEHPLDVLRESALDAVEAEAEAAVNAELFSLGEPPRSGVGLSHLRHLIAALRGRVLDPEFTGHPGHVDVAVAGDDATAHGRQGSSTDRRRSRHASNVCPAMERFRIGWTLAYA